MDVRDGIELAKHGLLGPSYLLVGEQAYWVEEWIRLVRTRVLGSHWEESYRVFEGPLDWKDIEIYLSTPGFFSEGRMVLVRDGRWPKKDETLKKYIDHPAPDGLLVIWEKKAAPAVEKLFGPERTMYCRPLTPAKFEAFVKQEAKRRAIQLTGAGLNAFCAAVFPSEFQALHELDKMTFYDPSRTWDQRDVGEFTVPFHPDQDTKLWLLTDPLIQRQPTETVERAQILLHEGKSPVLLLVVVARQLAQISRAHQFKKTGQTVSMFQRSEGLRDFVARKIWTALPKWDRPTLEWGLDKALFLDKAFKTGYGEPEVWLLSYVATLTAK